MSEADRQELRTFLFELEQVALAEIVIVRLPTLIPEETVNDLLESWQEVRPLFEEIRQQLSDAGDIDPEVDYRLAAAGLSGTSLKVRLGGFRRALGRLVGGFSARRLRRVLDWANRILGSLTSVVPGIEPVIATGRPGALVSSATINPTMYAKTASARNTRRPRKRRRHPLALSSLRCLPGALATTAR